MTAIVSFLVLSCTAVICSCRVNLEYLRRVRRFQSPSSTLDCFFICEAEGQVLQWGAGVSVIVSLVGYRKDEVGRTVVNAQKDFNVTSTLLLARPLHGGTHFVSVLIISTPGEDLSLSVFCTNNIVLSNISTECDPKYRENNDEFHVVKNRTIVFDYILSAPLLLQPNNSSVLLHIFMCETESLSQQVGRDDSGFGFSKNHEVGETRNELSADNTKVNIEAILISREQFETTSLVFIISNSNFTAICSFGSTEIHLKSQQAFAEYVVTPVPQSSAPLWTTNKYIITTSKMSTPIINGKLYISIDLINTCCSGFLGCN